MSDPDGAERPRLLPERLQLHVELPYKFQPRDDPRVRAWLARGYRIAQYQRVTDREALITLARASAPRG